MTDALCQSQLEQENASFAGTSGVSELACSKRFVPAFQDSETGRVEVSRFANGSEAPVHVLEGLPAEWATALDAEGRPSELKASIVSGFIRGDEFFTREQAAQAT